MAETKLLVKMNILPFRRRPYNIIGPLIEYSFRSWKFLGIRLNYSYWQYYYQQIPLTYTVFQPAILITIIGLFTIIFYLARLQWPDYAFAINLEQSAHIMNIYRLDLAIIVMIVVNITVEILWIFSIHKVLNYDSGMNNLLAYYSFYGDIFEIFPQYRQYILRLIIISDYISIIMFTMLLLSIICWMSIFYIKIIAMYLQNQIGLFFMFYSMIMVIIELLRLIYLVLAFTVPIKALIIMVEFFNIQFKQILFITKSLFNYRLNYHILIMMNMKKHWHRFHGKYVQLFDHTAKFNDDLKLILLAMETISKSTIICITIFYSRNVTDTVHGMMFIISLLTVFFIFNVIHSRFTHIPSYNKQCYRHLLPWNIHSSQRMMNFQSCRKNWLSFSYRYQIRTNLFIQTMNENPFGFTCGQIFFINKFNFVQVIMLDISLTLLFYKKICLNIIAEN